ncbi:MAG: DUF3221 domain-containing protein [Clostridia bacterium]|nr:DUF3221 domain-containing protein [Clostridia bacterium]
MRKFMYKMLLILTALTLASCNIGGAAAPDDGENQQARGDGGSVIGGAPEEGGTIEGTGDNHGGAGTDDNHGGAGAGEWCEDENSRVKMTAVVEGVGQKLEVTVTDSEYTFGIHWVITPDSTVYLDASGEPISRSDIKVGDTVEIWYSGQVMLSYPPQIVAHKIIAK